ncbi:MAG TPA: adenylyltransferase/cytidyltransferase family protein [Bacteroidales bacterium]|jgi:cytidyltransferase-like protein|nr:adenylyltransferase/cytidyltransferase family protein [Bacteroidales bacterium]OQB60403.1 MAG: Glycerol-3-phosphate cytidylyltransferase [Bacteroidetes bacterium ADurb.Bin145]HOU03519.1 adenylyltransferase/cytidyltransferase family protein [Bacteroidales bacterium]HQG63243.1 adenylyltransferase/cytidyltransferase family protein [Bacteroidales bacterium]HQK69370.1 adenylyltransferase/cytidyltransferase family protein [Bacteroidales bacterium]
MKSKKVLVSGCFDLLHGGHIAFLKTAASYGKVFVSVGTDDNLFMLKGKRPFFSQEERLYIIKSIRFVEDAFLSSGSGMLDFEPDMIRLKPDIFIVNSDGHTEEKKRLCNKLGVEYIILERIPETGLPARASSGIKKELRFPYRLCLAGGWVDQPWVSKICPGSVVVAQIWPTMDFNDRSGLATSSRNVAIKLWGDRYPEGDHEVNAKLLFGAENPPGKEYISGSQDHIGLLFPGINRLYYNGDYWPEKIDSTIDPEICNWLSNVLHLIPLEPRPQGYDPLKIMHLEKPFIKELGESGNRCWKSILKKDIVGLGRSVTDTILSWKKILPLTVPDYVMDELETKYFPDYPGAITSGSGGGYVIVVSEKPIEGAVRVKVRC